MPEIYKTIPLKTAKNPKKTRKPAQIKKIPQALTYNG